MTHIYERVRAILENTPGLTQKGLAERMGLNPAAVNRMLHGTRNIMAQEIPMIEEYLGVRLDLSGTAANREYRQDNRPQRRGFSDAPAVHFLHPPQEEAGNMVPVYSSAEARARGEIADWVVRHPALFGIANAFAIYVFSDVMEPRYFRGELVYLHPGRPPEANRDCLIETKSGEMILARFIRQNEREISITQFHPPAEKKFARDDIKAIYTVVGRG